MMVKAFIPAAGSLIYSIFYNFLSDLFGANIVTAIVWQAYFTIYILFKFTHFLLLYQFKYLIIPKVYTSHLEEIINQFLLV